MASKRRHVDAESIDLTSPRCSLKRQRMSTPSNSHKGNPIPKICKPLARYKPHAESGVGKDFHSVPYPLSLLPKRTWEALNVGDSNAKIVCPQCGKERAATLHQRKLFLVAERLSWEVGATSSKQREDNQIALWAVNAELAIFDPAVDEDEVVNGGRLSQANEWHPYSSQHEAEVAMSIVEKADMLSEASWQIWLQMVKVKSRESQHDQKTSEMYDTVATSPHSRVLNELSPNAYPHRTSPRKRGKEKASYDSPLSTPPSSAAVEGCTTTSEPVKCSYETLQDFYTLLDQIERTSPQGARYLEAYAELLHRDGCRDCWFKQTIVELPDDLLSDEEDLDEDGLEINSNHRPPPATELRRPAAQTLSRPPPYPATSSPQMPPGVQASRFQAPAQAPSYTFSHQTPRPAPAGPPMPNPSNPPHPGIHGPFPNPPHPGIHGPIPNPQHPQGISITSVPQYGGQAITVPSLPPSADRYIGPIAWLRDMFIADIHAMVEQVYVYNAYRQSFSFLPPHMIFSANEMIVQVLPQAFTSVSIQADRLPDGRYVIKGIRPKLERHSHGFAIQPIPPPPANAILPSNHPIPPPPANAILPSNHPRPLHPNPQPQHR